MIVAVTYPHVGLTTYRERAAWAVWDQPSDLLPIGYADSVVAAGGIPLLLPPIDPDRAIATAEMLDGLVLSGGADVSPERYGAQPHPQTGPIRPDRDNWEIALLHAALGRDIPVLAICRGIQVLNVALGGDLIQHLPDVVGNSAHCQTFGKIGRHDVRLAETSIVGGILGDTATVATHHHQAIDNLADGFVATGWAADDTIEAIERADSTWVVGVQWHPEAHGGAGIFGAFIAACRQSVSL
jgi:gamma-glutamyl-gamma-aminobutyrate hydrolase PuuD